ncbi:MAG: rod-binding protein [Lachnospiraceae bacterium]|nr:rod-binding protein [Lachnospiraceae bacterium]
MDNIDLSSLSNYYSSIADNYTSPTANSISGMSDKTMKGATEEELMDACKEFESYLLEQVFKQMDKTTKLFSDEEDSGSGTMMVDYFKDSTIAKLATQSTEQQGLGLAQMLYEQMSRNYAGMITPTASEDASLTADAMANLATSMGEGEE